MLGKNGNVFSLTRPRVPSREHAYWLLAPHPPNPINNGFRSRPPKVPTVSPLRFCCPAITLDGDWISTRSTRSTLLSARTMFPSWSAILFHTPREWFSSEELHCRDLTLRAYSVSLRLAVSNRPRDPTKRCGLCLRWIAVASRALDVGAREANPGRPHKENSLKHPRPEDSTLAGRPF